MNNKMGVFGIHSSNEDQRKMQALKIGEQPGDNLSRLYTHIPSK
jgi:hypothetical protein